ncbi:hypothetical protein C3492_43370 [Streptomyces sp. Ru62]|nr:hypothetical protein C3492_43370 [Streptomyces sp. Ru62]
MADGMVRRSPGWHRHMALATANHACLTARSTTARRHSGNGTSRLIHLSLAGIRHLLTRLTAAEPHQSLPTTRTQPPTG